MEFLESDSKPFDEGVKFFRQGWFIIISSSRNCQIAVACANVYQPTSTLGARWGKKKASCRSNAPVELGDSVNSTWQLESTSYTDCGYMIGTLMGMACLVYMLRQEEMQGYGQTDKS